MLKTFMIAAVAATFTAGFASAKGHDQSGTEVPGQSVGAETVTGAQGLGSAKGNRPDDKGPTKSKGIANAGR